MPHIHPEVAESDLSRLLQQHLVLHHRGKVRDTYLINPTHNRRRLVVTTDRTSAFDFVLGQKIPDKGKALNDINVHWRRVLADVPSDLIASGAEIDTHLPTAALRGNSELQARAIIAEDLEMFPGELIARGIMTGTAWKMYKTGERSLWRYPALPDGMNEWDDLPYSMFTPTNKADTGHDLPVTRQSVGSELESFTIQLFDRGRVLARECGLIMVDTKFEVGRRTLRTGWGKFKLADEVFTPDSSRYLHALEFAEDRRLGRKPRSFDKQIVRDYLMHAVLPSGDVIDVSQLEPKNPQDRDLVASIVMPDEIVEGARDRYLELLRMLTGHSLESFERTELGIVA